VSYIVQPVSLNDQMAHAGMGLGDEANLLVGDHTAALVCDAVRLYPLVAASFEEQIYLPPAYPPGKSALVRLSSPP